MVFGCLCSTADWGMARREGTKILFMAWTIPPRIVLGLLAVILLALMSFTAATGWCAAACAVMSFCSTLHHACIWVQANRAAFSQVAPQNCGAQQARRTLQQVACMPVV